MQYYTFETIKKVVLKWYQDYASSGKEYMQLVKNENEIIVIDLSFCNCMAQITVCNNDYAPFNYVSFEAATIDSSKALESGKPELVYFFYASKDTTEKDVIDALNIAVKYCLNYTPDFLKTKYINKKGVVQVDSEKMSIIIHPDDIKKIEQVCFSSEHICVDVQCQYLVLKSDELTFRVLPQFFHLV